MGGRITTQRGTMYKNFAYGVDVIRKFAAGNKLDDPADWIGEFGEYWNLASTGPSG